MKIKECVIPILPNWSIHLDSRPGNFKITSVPIIIGVNIIGDIFQKIGILFSL
jgi:hypothetical protein